MFGTKYVISPISVFSSYKNGENEWKACINGKCDFFFLHKGGGVGDEVSIFQWGTSCLDGRGHPMGNFKKITIELGGMPNQLWETL